MFQFIFKTLGRTYSLLFNGSDLLTGMEWSDYTDHRQDSALAFASQAYLETEMAPVFVDSVDEALTDIPSTSAKYRTWCQENLF
jgi:hypothetical protein